jgi:hypothetical protein
MPISRNYKKRNYQTESNYRVKIVRSVEIVEPEKAHIFTCAFCGLENLEKEYLRIHLINQPRAVCVHSKCLTDFLLKKGHPRRGGHLFAGGDAIGIRTHEGRIHQRSSGEVLQ